MHTPTSKFHFSTGQISAFVWNRKLLTGLNSNFSVWLTLFHHFWFYFCSVVFLPKYQIWVNEIRQMCFHVTVVNLFLSIGRIWTVCHPNCPHLFHVCPISPASCPGGYKPSSPSFTRALDCCVSRCPASFLCVLSWSGCSFWWFWFRV